MSSPSDAKAPKRKRHRSLSPPRSPARELKRPKSFTKPKDSAPPPENDEEEVETRPRKRPTNTVAKRANQRPKSSAKNTDREAQQHDEAAAQPRKRPTAIPGNRRREERHPQEEREPLPRNDDDEAPVQPRKRPTNAAALPESKQHEPPPNNDDGEPVERPRKRPTNAAAIPDNQRREPRPDNDDAVERPRKRPTNAAAIPNSQPLKSPTKPIDPESQPQNADDEQEEGEVSAQPRKRPTNAAVIPNNQRREARRLAEEREARERRDHQRPAAGVSDFVKQHYNAVPERGRQWRKTDSKIRGLRSFNNWVKSALMHKCVPRDEPDGGDGQPRRPSRIKVLDIGCGKGGDLMKWQTQRVDVYVGLDPADVSVHQARERYRAMARRAKFIFRAEFIVRDCFGRSLEDVPAVKNVGFDKNIRDRWGGGGFDVVSMMFCMHYAFESEEKAKCMLMNVAASLKRGGKLIGVVPNSDVLSDKVHEFHRRKSGAAEEDDDDNWDPEKSLDAKADEPAPNDDEETGPLNWGNSIYQVKFPGKLPVDGVFRPPFGWKYFYFLEEAVEQVPEFVVPWEAFRGMAEDFNLELEYRRTFRDIWRDLKDDPVLGPLSCRMGVRDQDSGALLVTEEEMEAAGFYHAFSFVKV